MAEVELDPGVERIGHDPETEAKVEAIAGDEAEVVTNEKRSVVAGRVAETESNDEDGGQVMSRNLVDLKRAVQRAGIESESLEEVMSINGEGPRMRRTGSKKSPSPQITLTKTGQWPECHSFNFPTFSVDVSFRCISLLPVT